MRDFLLDFILVKQGLENLTAAKIVQLGVSRAKRKKPGVFYTPGLSPVNLTDEDRVKVQQILPALRLSNGSF
jgi:hypothetical protein